MTTRKTYGRLRSIAGVGWEISYIAPHVALRLKSNFPGIRRASTAPFTLAGGPQLAADLAWFLGRYPMEMSVDDRALLTGGKARFERDQAEVEGILADSWKPSQVLGFKGNASPYPYQAQAAELTHKLGRLLLMDDVGLGKTVSAMATMVRKEALPAAVVVQPHLAVQWQTEVEEFTTLRCHIIKGTKPYELPEVDVYIFKYSNMAGWVDYFDKAPFKGVFFDEIQELRNGTKTSKGAAARILCNHATIKMGLSATPIYNYGDEMWNVINFIDAGALGSRDDFLREWCRPHGSHQVVKDPEALGTYLRELHLVLRRDEVEVDQQRPPLNTIMMKAVAAL